MLQKPAILYVEKITCEKTTGEAGEDEVALKVTVDGVEHCYPSRTGRYKFKKDGGTQYVDITINVTYANKVVFELIERDAKDQDIDDSENEWIGSHTLNRGSVGSSPDSRTVDMDANGSTSGEYTLTYRIISDPIPTVRVLGIRCEQQSAGMNVDLVETIAGAASTVTEEAGKVIGKSPRPRAKAIGKAFEVASEVLNAISYLGEWIGHIIEGKYDEVYMDHVESDRGYNGAFFPPDSDYEKMESGDDMYFEEKYGHYFRFPLDRGPVSLQFREHDGGKTDVNIGTLTITPDNLNYGSSAGVSGTTVNGGVAEMNGPAVVELASLYGNRGGEGALYHICYSVGFEDWCLPATTDGQQDLNDIPPPEPGKYYNIVANHSGKVLDVEKSSTSNGTNIIQWDASGSDNQAFKLQEAGDGYYRIIAKHSGKDLGVEAASQENGAPLIQWENEGQSSHLFKLKEAGGGYYRIAAKHSGKVIDVYEASRANGADVVQWNPNQKNSHLFKLEAEDDGYYRIIAKHSGKELGVEAASQENGAPLIQWKHNEKTSHLFKLEEAGGGYYRIIAKHSGKELDVYEASIANGAKIVQWERHENSDENPHRLFKFEEAGEGYYHIIAKHSGKELGVNAASHDNGVNIIQWEADIKPNHAFRFDPA